MVLTLQFIKNRTRLLFDKIRNFLLRWRIVVLLFATTFLGIFEIIEHPDFLTDNSYYFFKEIAFYYTLIAITAVMVEVAIKAVIAKNQTIKILDARHNLSMQLISAKNWEDVVTRVIQYPASILPVSATSLLIFDEVNDNFATEVSWIAPSENIEIQVKTISRDACCTDDISSIAPNVHLVDCEKFARIDDGKRQCYHISINYGDLPIGMLYMILPKHKYLTNEHAQLLSNTADDIAVGLSAANQRQRQHAIEVTQAANNERLEIARDLHDSLGQNLGYLHLKLDQILTAGEKYSLRTLENELEHLRELANESYELVRNTLVILHHGSEHRINELFKAHTQIIAKRTGILVSIDEVGLSRSLPPYYLKQLLFAFKESLINIEKHSGATQAKVSLTWTETQLKVRIWDDGRGFEVNLSTDIGHYGLRIIDERIKSLGGKFEINSSQGEGTEVMFWLPLTISENEPANIQAGEL
jgi:signal transduction histidine kinase